MEFNNGNILDLIVLANKNTRGKSSSHFQCYCKYIEKKD